MQWIPSDPLSIASGHTEQLPKSGDETVLEEQAPHSVQPSLPQDLPPGHCSHGALPPLNLPSIRRGPKASFDRGTGSLRFSHEGWAQVKCASCVEHLAPWRAFDRHFCPPAHLGENIRSDGDAVRPIEQMTDGDHSRKMCNRDLSYYCNLFTVARVSTPNVKGSDLKNMVRERYCYCIGRNGNIPIYTAYMLNIIQY